MANTEKDVVDASPSKSFFVEMLTRDIELKDAILDLLDNCLDGVLRSLKAIQENPNENEGVAQIDAEKPYKGYYAHITFDKESFMISDNCGGMTKEILEKHAFRLGRPALEKDENLATVGLYGIGMKRAIFKLGESCVVSTRHDDKAYEVEISPEWTADDNDWSLDISEIEPIPKVTGTEILIGNLRKSVQLEFDTTINKSFENDFQSLVSTHYSYIIHKGFEVKVNGNEIKPKEIQLRYAGKDKISPFLYKGEIDGVNVELVVGLYRNIPTNSELEELDAGKGNRKENSGWTVICNDRVVLFNDTSHLTGWGEASVPKFHTQFIAISGVVKFSSNNPNLLPLTTTKRGINLNSPLYATVKNIMREGTKHFTDFTNKWKSDSEERRQIYNDTRGVEPLKAFALISDNEWKASQKFTGKIYKPKLPSPKEDVDPKRIIHFMRPLSEIKTVATYILSDAEAIPSTVGEKCFDDYLALAKENI